MACQTMLAGMRFSITWTQNSHVTYDSFLDPTSDLLQQLKQLEITVEKNKLEVTTIDNKDKEQDDKLNQLDDKQINVPAQGETL